MHKTFKLISYILIFTIIFSFVIPIDVYSGNIINPPVVVQIPTNDNLTVISQPGMADSIGILGELNDKRDRYQKYFELKDHTFEVIAYPYPVHFIDNGNWTEIDNQLMDSIDSKGNEVFKNKANDFNVNISKKSGQKDIISIEKNDAVIGWNIEKLKTTKNINKRDTDASKPVILDTTLTAVVSAEYDPLEAASENKVVGIKQQLYSKVSYKGVFKDVDLEYYVQPDSVKENIIIKGKQDSYGYVFNLTASGVKLEENSDGSISFIDSNDTSKETFKLEAPVMEDAAGATSTTIKVEVLQEKGSIKIIYLPDENWLNASERVFPIIIDPYVKIPVTSGPINDTYVSSASPNTNYSNSTDMKVENDTYEKQVLVNFTLPQLDAGSFITKAVIGLYTTTSTTASVRIASLAQSWDPATVTYATRPTASSDLEDYNTITSQGAYTWDITKTVNKMYHGQANYGFVFSGGVQSPAVSFNTSEYTGDSSQKPYVKIYYSNYSGLEDYWTYHIIDNGRAGTGYINNANGNLTFIHSDLEMSGNRMPLSIYHVWNTSSLGTDLGYGNGFILNIDQRVAPLTYDGQQYYIYTDEDGTKHYFSYAPATGTYIDEDGLGFILTVTSSGYTIKDKTDNILEFTGQLLTKITDAHNNNQIISRDSGTGRITSVVDASGRTASFSYSNDRLSSIQRPDLATMSFTYTNGNLTNICEYDQENSAYTYTSGGLLQTATNNDNRVETFQYYSIYPYAVQNVLESNTDETQGQTLNITYGVMQTKFTDSSGKTTTYQFNNHGNTTCIIDALGNAKFFEYFEGGKLANKTALESKTQGISINLLRNNGFENSDGLWVSQNEGGSLGSSSMSMDYPAAGSYSMKVIKTNTGGKQYVSQAVSLQKGVTYTLLPNFYDATNCGGGWEAVKYKDSSGQDVVVDRALLNTNGVLCPLVFTLPEDSTSNSVTVCLGINNVAGTVYFDSVQLEKGTHDNRYNFVQNPDMTYSAGGLPDYWQKNTDCDVQDTVTVNTDNGYPVGLDNNCFKIVGQTGKSKELYQTSSIRGKAGEVLSFGAWAKADSISLSTSTGRSFSIKISLTRNDDSIQTAEYPYNIYVEDWQYAAGYIKADSDFKSVKMSLVYANNLNTAYFDGIQLHLEGFGDSYDDNGNLTNIQDVQGKNTSFGYNTSNDVTGVTYPDQKQVSLCYTNHKLTGLTSAENRQYSSTPDVYGNILTEQIGDSEIYVRTSHSYTTSGEYENLQTDALGNTTQYNYNESNDTLTSVVDGRNNTVNYTYDTINRLTGVSATVNGVQISDGYAYVNDRLDTITHNGFNYTFGYDSLNNNTSVSIAGNVIISNSYDMGKGLLNSTTYGNGDTISYDYDDLYRVTAIKENGAARYGYTYDTEGYVAQIKNYDTNSTDSYYYDLMGKETEHFDSYGNYSGFTYDDRDRVSTVNNSVGMYEEARTTYRYDGDGNQATVVLHNNATFGYNYDAVGRLKNISLNTGEEIITQSYNYQLGVSGSSSMQLESMTTNGDTYSYTYDANGNIQTITDGSNTIRYYYDELNEVTREDNQVLNKTITYSYDNGGNITTRTEYAYTTSPDPINPTATIPYSYNTTIKDLMQSYNSKNVTYDAIGNPISYDGKTYTWDQGRELSGISGGGTTTSYKYNDQGIRVQKTVNEVTTNYFLDGDSVVYESNGIDQIYYSYDANGSLAALTLNGTTYYYQKNGQGDIIGLIDDTGTKVVGYTYDTWGKLISITGTLASTVGVKNPYRYREYRYDTETGLYYLQSRYYNPEWGRFVNADDTDLLLSLGSTDDEILDTNLFAYCGNNPVMNIDPNGDVFFLAALAIPYVAATVYSVGVAVCGYFAIKHATDVVYSNPTVQQKRQTVPDIRAGIIGQGKARTNLNRKKNDFQDRSNKKWEEKPKKHTPKPDHRRKKKK